ncbi:MAG: hypothetical protein RR248_00390 [Clostridia bacterium]
MNRGLCFILGMLFGIIFLFAAIFGVGFYAYKEGTLEMVGIKNDALGQFQSMKVENLIDVIINMSKNPDNSTLTYLNTEYGFDLNSLVGLDTIKQGFYEEIKDAKLGFILQGDINGFLNTINLGVGLVFADGVVSKGGYEQLKDISLTQLLGALGDTTQLVGLLKDVKLGAVLGSKFTEVETPLGSGIYEYTAIPGTSAGVLGLLANCSIGSVAGVILGGEDILMAIASENGGLKSLGELKLDELLKDTGFGNIVKDKKIADLIKITGNVAKLELGGLFDGLYVGALLKYDHVDVNPDPAIEELVWQDKGVKVDALMTALADIELGKLISGGSIDFNSLLGDLYIGEVMKYTKGEQTNKAETDIDPTITPKYAWDNSGTAVEGLELSMANVKLTDITGGKFDAMGIVGDVKLGSLLGLSDTATGIMAVLKNKTVNDLKNGAIDNILLGEVLNLVKHNNIWYETFVAENDPLNKEATGIFKTLADLKISELSNSAVFNDKLDTAKIKDLLEFKGTETGIMKELGDKTIADLKNGTAIDNLKVGVTLGLINVGGVWYETYTDDNNASNDVLASGINKALADMTIKDLADSTKLNAKIDTIKLGELLNIKDGEKGILGSLKDKTVAELKNGTAIDTVKVGVVLGLTEVGGIWYESYTDATTNVKAQGLYSALASLTVKELGDITKDIDGNTAIDRAINGIKLGELLNIKDGEKGILGSLKDKTVAELKNGTAIDTVKVGVVLGLTEVGGIWYESYTDATTNVKAKGIYSALASLTVKELGDTTKDANGNTVMDRAINGIKLGELLNLTGKETGIMGSLANKTVAELKNGTAVDNVKVGVVLGLIEVGGIWYESYTDATINVKAKGIYSALADLTIKEFGNSSIVDSKVNYIKLGELLDITSSTKGVLGALADKSINDIKNGAIDKIEVGVVLGLTKANGVWYKTYTDDNNASNDVLASGIDGALAGLTIGTMDAVTIKNKVNGLKLADLIDCTGTPMLKLLANATVGDIGSRLDQLYLGEVLDYTLIWTCANPTPGHLHSIVGCAHVWAKEVTNIANYTVTVNAMVKKDSIGNIIMKSGEKWYQAEQSGAEYAFADCDGLTKVMADTKIAEANTISGKLTTWVQKAKIQTLIDMNVLNFDSQTKTNLTRIFGDNSWSTRSMPGFINSLIYKISNPMSSIPDDPLFK